MQRFFFLSLTTTSDNHSATLFFHISCFLLHLDLLYMFIVEIGLVNKSIFSYFLISSSQDACLSQLQWILDREESAFAQDSFCLVQSLAQERIPFYT